MGSSWSRAICYDLVPEKHGPVAQRLEQGTHNPLVPGSNPGGPSPESFRGCHAGPSDGACRCAAILVALKFEIRSSKSETISKLGNVLSFDTLGFCSFGFVSSFDI